MECTDNNNLPVQEDNSVAKATVQGAVTGSILWPALGIAWDTVARHKSFVAGNRLRFIASEAVMGAIVNGLLNGTLAWWQNRVNHRRVEKAAAQEQKLISTDLTPRY